VKPALLASLLLTLCGCATPGGAASAGAPAPAALASGLPDFELRTLDGESFRLSDHLGKQVLVLSFWDTWCEPCKTEMPQLDHIYQAHKDAGLLIAAVAMDDPSTVANVGPYIRRNGFQFPVLLDTETKAANLYNTHKYAPYTVVISREGKIVSEKQGYEPGAEKALEAEVAALLGESPKP
jgi:peroxiredoxin